MSHQETAGLEECPSSPQSDMSVRGALEISQPLEKLEQTAALLYTNMANLAVPEDALGALREIVREIGELRLGSEMLESDYQAALGTLRTLEGGRGGHDGETAMSDEELDRMKSLPDSLAKAVEEQEAFAQEMNRLQAGFDDLTARLERAEAALLEAQRSREEALQKIGAAEAKSKQAHDALSKTEGEAKALKNEIARAQTEQRQQQQELDQARSLGAEVSKLQGALTSAGRQSEELQAVLEKEHAARRADAEGVKVLSNENSSLRTELEQARGEREALSQSAMKASQELEAQAERLSKREEENAALTSAAGRHGAEAADALRQLRTAVAARELAEDRERVLREQRSKDEVRAHALEGRVQELLAQRAEIEKELQVARGAIKNVEANVAALCAVQRRMRAGGGE